MVWWAGKSSDDLLVCVEHYPVRIVPKRRRQTITVPGRSGDLHIVEDAWENYIQPYDIYLSAEAQGLPRVAEAVAAWLSSPRDYERLEDDYNPGVYRMASFVGPLDIANTLNLFGKATVNFDCKPQRWLTSGEEAMALGSGGVVYNPTAFAARPLITVTGSGNGTLTVNGHVLTLTGVSGSIILDCDLETAYKGSSNLNSAVTGDFPELAPGENTVALSGLTAVEIIPRWWTL